jgi:hypothetical protein
MKNIRGGRPTFQRSTIYLSCFHTLSHSFASTKNLTLFFSSNSELFRKNTRGGGGAASYARSELLGVGGLFSVTLCGGGGAIGDLQEFVEGIGADFGEADEYPRVVTIVVGDVVDFRVGGHQLFALVEGHLDDEGIGIFAEADEEFSFHLQGRCAVGVPASTCGKASAMRRTVS